MAFPANPTTGQIYTNASGQKFIYSAAGGWKANAVAAGSSGPAAPISSATAPANPSLGQLWYDTSADTLYLRVNDGTSDVWFDISSVGAATATTWTTATRPSAPTAGTSGFNTTTGKVEYWNGTAWTSVATGSGGVFNPSSLGTQVFASNAGTSTNETYDITAWNSDPVGSVYWLYFVGSTVNHNVSLISSGGGTLATLAIGQVTQLVRIEKLGTNLFEIGTHLFYGQTPGTSRVQPDAVGRIDVLKNSAAGLSLRIFKQ